LGVPSYIVDIWEKNYSPYLLPVQEEAARYYGILDYDGDNSNSKERWIPAPAFTGGTLAGLTEKGSNEIASLSSVTCNDKNGNQNLLVISPTSSGKTFIGEMAAVTQAIHHKKVIYLVPLRSLAEEKYQNFKKLYTGANCKINILVSSRDRREDDKKIIKGDYQIAVMVYEKFNYLLLKYPHLLEGVSLIVIDELQMIHDPSRGPLLEGIFRYITHNKNQYGEEEFFSAKESQNSSYEDCLKNTISYFIQKDEPTLLFFPTKKET